MEPENKSDLERTPLQQALDKHGEIVMQGPLSAFTTEAPPEKKQVIGFAFTPNDYGRVSEIIDRCNRFAIEHKLPEVDKFLASVDLFASHTNDWPIDFQAMCDAPFMGDVMQFIAGVGLRIDRSTGRLAGNWRGQFHIKVS